MNYYIVMLMMVLNRSQALFMLTGQRNLIGTRHFSQARCFASSAAAITSASSSTEMKKTVLVPITDGTEELEAVSIIDTLRRSGASVTVAKVFHSTESSSATSSSLIATCSHGTRILADAAISDCVSTTWDAIVCPGGMPGATRLHECPTLSRLLRSHHQAGRLIGALCASPAVVLAPLGILAGKKSTCYPAKVFEDALPSLQRAAVVVDGNAVTGAGPGSSLPFALAVVKQLIGKDTAQTVADGMLFTLHV